MYSRNRTMSAEARYAENVPPVYGGSRFYRHARDAEPAEIRTEDVRVAVPVDGIPVQYEAPPKLPPSVPEERAAAAEADCPVLDESDGACDQCQPYGERAESDGAAGEQKKAEGFLSSILDDQEEILLLGLFLLLCCENERAVDVIVILLLLIIIR